MCVRDRECGRLVIINSNKKGFVFLFFLFFFFINNSLCKGGFRVSDNLVSCVFRNVWDGSDLVHQHNNLGLL